MERNQLQVGQTLKLVPTKATATGKTINYQVNVITSYSIHYTKLYEAKVPVFQGDTAEELAARVLTQEHQIYPLVANWFCQGRLKMQDGRAWLDGQPLPATGYASDDETE